MYCIQTESAIATYTHLHPDIVLLDAMMPVMDGLSCCAQLQALPDGKNTPVLMITIYFLQAVANVLATAIERQRVEDALKESEERCQLALQGNNDGVWDWNVKNDEVFFSTRWKQMLGYKEHEISNQLDEWATRVHPDDIGFVRQAIADHFAKITPFFISEHRVRCKDDTYKWVLDRGQAVWNEDGNVVRMTSCYTDITERKQAEEQLRQSEERFQIVAPLAQSLILEQETRQQQQLIRSNEELKQFAFIASHDLQEPLRKIKTFGDTLSE